MFFPLSIFLVTAPAFMPEPEPIVEIKFHGSKISEAGGSRSVEELAPYDMPLVSSSGNGKIRAEIRFSANVLIDWTEYGLPQRNEFFKLKLRPVANISHCSKLRGEWKTSMGQSGPSMGSQQVEIFVKLANQKAKTKFTFSASSFVEGVTDKIEHPSRGSADVRFEVDCEPVLPGSPEESMIFQGQVSYFDSALGRIVRAKSGNTDDTNDKYSLTKIRAGYRISPELAKETLAPIITLPSRKPGEPDKGLAKVRPEVPFDSVGLEELGAVAFGKNWRKEHPMLETAWIDLRRYERVFWNYPAVAIGPPLTIIKGRTIPTPVATKAEKDPIWAKTGKPGERLPRIESEFKPPISELDLHGPAGAKRLQWYGGLAIYHHKGIIQIRSAEERLLKEAPLMWREHVSSRTTRPDTYSLIMLGLDYDGGPHPVSD